MEHSEKYVLITVLLLTIFWQLVYAVAVGLVLAAVLFLKRMSDISADKTIIRDLTSPEEEPSWEDETIVSPEIRRKVIFKHLEGPMFFGMTTFFRNKVADMMDIQILVLRLEKVPFMDQSGVYALESSIEGLHKRKVIVAITGANEQVLTLMKDMNIIPRLISDRHVFVDLPACSDWLREMLEKEEGMSDEFKSTEATH